MTITLPLPFRSSRPLGQGNAFLAETGVALDVVGIDLEEGLHHAWRARIERTARLLHWPAPRFAVGREGRQVTLMFTAPADQLRTAREANEWALCAALLERDPAHWSSLQESLRASSAVDPQRPGIRTDFDDAAALAWLTQLAAAEATSGGA